MRPPAPADREAWADLYAGYTTFYNLTFSSGQADVLWRWVLDPAHATECLLAIDPSGSVRGLAHFRAFPRPSTASTGGYLDDLFVEPGFRGHGAADLLLSAVRELAAERGWTVVRWITADDNYRARGKYDLYAKRTPWITYDMSPGTSETDDQSAM